MARSRRLQTHLPAVPAVISLQRIVDYGYSFWARQPTIEQSHFDDLKYVGESPMVGGDISGRIVRRPIRVWVSRQSLADYDGDRRAYNEDRFTVERLVNGQWEGYDYLGRRKY